MPIFDEPDDEPGDLGNCSQCGDTCSWEELIDGLCPECYGTSLPPPAGCECEEEEAPSREDD